tara:strand:+ start:1131 stop:3380 length:2250 start_codon:yes stop_codon:yes gene_type:complete
MLFSKIKILLFILLYLFSFVSYSKSEVVSEIVILGNERVSDETIIMFSDVKINENIDTEKLNKILINLYDSNFFENVSISLKKNKLEITVDEFPIIDNIKYSGIKSKTIKKEITQNLKLKSRSSLNPLFLEDDKEQIVLKLKNLGYYFSNIEIFLEDLQDNRINVEYKINLGEKAKIKKITFIGDKVYKDSKLRSLIVSEEYKFWKFISGKKYLNENMISLDQRLLKNFYLNKGYYDVKINTSFAKMINKEEFELIFNIQANKKYIFNDLRVTLPVDFEESNFLKLKETFNKLKGETYSINSVQDILEKIEEITLYDEYKSINALVDEDIIDNKINLNFIIEEMPKLFVEKINIFGNNITRENVIRNQVLVDEGDPFNILLTKKSINNLRSTNLFKSVNYKVNDGSDNESKIIDITVEEKATGEITAGAGFGTDGGTLLFGIRENNYLGKGLIVKAQANLSADSIKGELGITNPNYKNSDKMVFSNFKASEIDRLTSSGYKTNKTGFEFGTKFEYLEDFKFGASGRSFYEKIETDATASATQQKQEGDYWDTFLNLDFDYDKRNQKFQTTKGFRSIYSLDLPLLSKTNTLTNTYDFKKYIEIYENNRTSLSFGLKSAFSLTGEDVKLSERLLVPSSKLRGFEFGKVGPKDGSDFIGGNYVTSFNIQSTLPYLFENAQNLDMILFFDSANVWGVDYDSSINNSNKIRSSIGLSLDWFTPIGPMTFSLSEALTKNDTDVTETFRFNIGTSF